ncbi:hypothetical protein [Acidianus ambivalens]|uniref:Uncharacterized protein n=1 Tax=Acidianus ambivalens TaxID=2283 RepID=A0A650CUB1_ACIAM|nr:hypothetical protein [Acidianus ambivalens]MQL56064.1 hypothetical protein [Acidianus ambivalens]QGR21383.1 hypothetical protein D1866_04805 [Acidianus ambivalens]
MYGIKIDHYLEFEDHTELISVISRTDNLLKYRPIFSTDSKKNKILNVLLIAINIELEKPVNILRLAILLRPATSLKTDNFKGNRKFGYTRNRNEIKSIKCYK